MHVVAKNAAQLPGAIGTNVGTSVVQMEGVVAMREQAH
jgi:hypothetical protein